MICPACAGETFSLKDRSLASNCTDCYVVNSEYFSKSPEIQNRNCKCHAFGHPEDKEVLINNTPLSDTLLDEIKTLHENEQSDTARNYYEVKAQKEIDEQLKYAEDNPRQ